VGEIGDGRWEIGDGGLGDGGLGNVEASEEGFARFIGIDAHRDAATMRFTRSPALRLCGLEVKGKLLVFRKKKRLKVEKS
jgi:hypothetical protein